MTILSIPDMSCAHCKASVEAALAPLVDKVEVDLPARRVLVEGASNEAVLAAVESVGFQAKIIG